MTVPRKWDDGGDWGIFQSDGVSGAVIRLSWDSKRRPKDFVTQRSWRRVCSH